MTLAKKVMTSEPYASAERVFWVGRQRLELPQRRRVRPADRTVSQRDHGHTPLHAFWLNQVGIFFSYCSEKLCLPATSPALTRSETVSAPSSVDTTRPPVPLSGS